MRAKRLSEGFFGLQNGGISKQEIYSAAVRGPGVGYIWHVGGVVAERDKYTEIGMGRIMATLGGRNEKED